MALPLFAPSHGHYVDYRTHTKHSGLTVFVHGGSPGLEFAFGIAAWQRSISGHRTDPTVP